MRRPNFAAHAGPVADRRAALPVRTRQRAGVRDVPVAARGPPWRNRHDRRNVTVDHYSNVPPGTAGSTAARECAAIASDLARLTALIADAGDKLLVSFNQVSAIAPRLAAPAPERAALNSAIGSAVTALQFQDMATQLTQHAQRRLTQLEKALSTLAEEAHDPLTAPTRMQPVRQDGMGAGSIDLF
ncbi:MAG: hypothetical protein MZW92_54225 [Comamonadaceae bacterium]|nr:hypothetical protein [Comamonadaceae bacterium]